MRPTTFMRALIPLAVLAIALACSKEPSESADYLEVAPAPIEAKLAAEPSGGTMPAAPQKLIRTSSIQIEVKNFDEAVQALDQLAKSLKGYVADTQVTRHPGEYRTGRVILRIPSERFDAVGSSLRSLGKVLSEQSSIEDVTKAYADLETRLKVKREALARIRELLKTKAGNLKDVLEAEREISRITEEIELAEGERRFYDHQIRLSTFTVELQEPVPVNLASPSAWGPLGEVLRNSSAMIAKSLSVLLSVILVLIPWSLAAYGTYRWIRWMLQRRKTRLQAKPSAPETKGSESA